MRRVVREAFIIATHEPSLDVFEPDYRTRKTTLCILMLEVFYRYLSPAAR